MSLSHLPEGASQSWTSRRNMRRFVCFEIYDESHSGHYHAADGVQTLLFEVFMSLMYQFWQNLPTVCFCFTLLSFLQIFIKKTSALVCLEHIELVYTILFFAHYYTNKIITCTCQSAAFENEKTDKQSKLWNRVQFSIYMYMYGMILIQIISIQIFKTINMFCCKYSNLH